MTNYGNESITSLEGARQVRDKPSNLLGSADVTGAFHTWTEVAANSFDELRAMRAYLEKNNTLTDDQKTEIENRIKRLLVTYTKDKVVTFEDFGRGLPVAFNTLPREWKYNWHLTMSKLYAGGKYSDELDGGTSNYSRSLGTNGLGTTLAQYTSSFFKALVKRDGKIYKVNFKEGMPLAHYWHTDDKHYMVLLDLEYQDIHYVGAKVRAFDDEGVETTLELADFDPFKDARYKVDRAEAERIGLTEYDKHMYKVRDEKGYILKDEENKAVERPSLFQQLYHSVLEVEEDPTVPQITGTKLTWHIDNRVFKDTDFTQSMIVELLQTQANVNGATVVLDDEYHNLKATYEGTTTHDYFQRLVGKENILGEASKSIRSQGVENGKRYILEGDFTVAFIKEDPLVSQKHLLLQNTSVMSEGVHVDRIEKALDAFFNKVAKSQGIEKKMNKGYYANKFAFKIDTYSNVNAISFIGQTKRGVSNAYIGEAIKSTITEILEDQYKRRNPALVKIVNQALELARLKLEEEQEKQTAKQVGEIAKKKLDLSKIFSDCTSTDIRENELLIVEGLSAKDATVNSRNAKTQAIIGIQGKLPNALKTPIDELLQNKVVQALIKVIGVGIDVSNGSNATFNYKGLKYGKIIIMTDADEDGKQIRMLIFVLFMRLMRELIQKGHIYMLETPIISYELSEDSHTQAKAREVLGAGHHKYAYAYTMADVAPLAKSLKEKGISLGKMGRYKGLGSFTADKLHYAGMIPETRRLTSLQMDLNVPVVKEVIDILFGKDVGRNRKEVVLASLGIKLQQEEMIDFVEQLETLEEVVVS